MVNPKTIDDVFKSTNRSIVWLQKNTDPILVEKGIESLVINFATFFNLSKPMSIAQIKETAQFIIEDYSLFKPDDIVLCFKNAKKGCYGEINSAMDGTKILSFLHKYELERELFFVNFRIKEGKERIIEEKAVNDLVEDSPEIMVDHLKNMIDSLGKNITQKNNAGKNAVSITDNGERKMINRWLNQFENLKKKYPHKVVFAYGTYEDLLKIGERTFGRDSFLHHKMKNRNTRKVIIKI